MWFALLHGFVRLNYFLSFAAQFDGFLRKLLLQQGLSLDQPLRVQPDVLVLLPPSQRSALLRRCDVTGATLGRHDAVERAESFQVSFLRSIEAIFVITSGVASYSQLPLNRLWDLPNPCSRFLCQALHSFL